MLAISLKQISWLKACNCKKIVNARFMINYIALWASAPFVTHTYT